MTLIFEIFLIAILIILNGLLVMSEFAIVAAKKSRLQQRADKGDKKAADALALAEEPTNSLSTIQIGITLISIVIGAYGGATAADVLSSFFSGIPALAPYSETLGLVIVVIVVTYFTLLFGEIVPKWIGMNDAENISSKVARPVRWLSTAMYPVMMFLSLSTEVSLRLMGFRKGGEPPVTEEEIKILIEQGAEAGVFHESEAEMVEGIFNLGDQKVGRYMILKPDIVAIDINDPPREIWKKMSESKRSYFPVYRDELDNLIGIVAVRDVFVQMVNKKPLNMSALLSKPLYVSETLSLLGVLESFREAETHIAIVVDEYGTIQGLITLHDILEAIVGDLPSPDQPSEGKIVERDDSSWLVDGSVTVEDFHEQVGLLVRTDSDADRFHTIAGFIMQKLQRIPKTGEHFEFNGYRFEVVDMDGNRIDKVLVVKEVHEGSDDPVPVRSPD